MQIGERELGLRLMMNLYAAIINSFKIVTLDVDVAYSSKVIVEIPNFDTKFGYQMMWHMACHIFVKLQHILKES